MSNKYIEGKIQALSRDEFLRWTRNEIEGVIEEMSEGLGHCTDDEIESIVDKLLEEVELVLESDLSMSVSGKRIASIIHSPWDWSAL